MPLGSFDQNLRVLPYRSTSVTFDEHLPNVVQPWTAYERNAGQMALSPIAEKTNVQYIPGIGWQLRSVGFDFGDATELTTAQAGYYTVAGGTLTVAGGMVNFDLFKQQSLVGVAYNPDVALTGSPAYQKRVADGDSWNDALSADQTAWPTPNASSDAVTLDRIAKTTMNHEPEDTLFFTLYLPPSVTALSNVAALHFCGPAGTNTQGTGTGQYCLKLSASGSGTLYEKKASDGSWMKRHTLKWAEGSALKQGAWIYLAITSDSRDDGTGSFKGTKIVFSPLALQQSQNFINAFASYAESKIRQGNPEQYGLVYNVPTATPTGTTLAPVRIDLRRDVRAIVQIGQLIYPDEGVLYDDILSIPYFPNADPANPFFLYWWGYVPTGCTLDAKIYDADTGIILSDETTITTDRLGGIKSFTPNLLQRRYRVKITFTTNGSNQKTPTLTDFQILRSNLFETPTLTTATVPQQDAAPALPRTQIEGMTITGPEDTPSVSGASFAVHDYTGELATLFDKGGFPVKVETTYDVGGTNKSTLFQGYVQVATAEWKKGGDGYAGENWREYKIQAAAEWTRLAESRPPQRFTWFDKAANLPYKATDAIRDMLLTCYPSSMVDVPDIDIRLFSLDQNSLILEAGTSIGDAAFSMARDYLGGYLVFDENAGTVGMWRLLQPKSPPYNILARFYIEHPGNGKLPHISASYGSSTSGSQTILHTYARAGSYAKWVERAEGNMVIVCGGALGADSSNLGAGSGEAARITQCAVNVNSYNFLDLSPGDPGYPDGTHPDYIGRQVPIFVSDRTLTSQIAVDWLTRRVYDRAAHARTRLTFESPLILVTDSTDAMQTRPRPLRYYDAVEVQNLDGTFDTYLVLSCTPSFSNDGAQFARYELVRQSNIDDLASMPSDNGATVGLLRRVMMMASGIPERRQFWASNQQTTGSNAEWMALAEPTSLPLQDLDNTSPTFGDFYYTMGYDPLP